jgi:hypothetical protein
MHVDSILVVILQTKLPLSQFALVDNVAVLLCTEVIGSVMVLVGQINK